MQQEIEKMFCFSERTASELAVLHCLDYEENTCHWQSIC